MTERDKQLLLKDLCARLPYGVYIHHKNFPEANLKLSAVFGDGRIGVKLNEIGLTPTSVNECKPYLRPMSSMTEEEREYLMQHINRDFVDYCNEHHLDNRRLISMGLALKAPNGMYNKEEPEKGSEIPIPKTVDEAVKTLAKIVSKEDRDYLLENGAISMHDSLGRWIRNEWGLWTGSELKDELMNMNKGLNHPDDMSNYIIEEFIKYWNNKI